MSWQAKFRIVEPYIVKILTPAGAGTGFFFAYNEDKSLIGIATALHVVDEAHEWRQPLKIRHVTNNAELFVAADQRGILVDYKRDSAVVLLQTTAVADAGIPVPAEMLPLFPSDKVKKIGVGLAWAGYPAFAPTTLCLFQGGVSAFNKDDDSYYIDGIAINGVSGGPVFDDANDEPKIVGIVSAYRYNRTGGAALPGLLMVHDATHLNDTVEELKSLDEARKKGAETARSQIESDEQSTVGPAEPGTTAEGTAGRQGGPHEPTEPPS